MADAYDKQASDYLQSVTDSERRTTQTGRQQFDRNRQSLDLGMKRDREDYAKYTGRQQADFNRNLAASDKDFAKKLSAAANGYGVRGLLNTGMFAKNQNEMVSDQGDTVATYKLNFQRQQEDAASQMSRSEQDYNQNVANNDLNAANYDYSRKRAENLA